MATVSRYYEVVGGSLDGEVREIRGSAHEYWHVSEDVSWAERYEVQPVAKRDAEGRPLRRTCDCLVHAETMSVREMLS